MVYLCGNEYVIVNNDNNIYSIKGSPWKVTEEMIDEEIMEEDEEIMEEDEEIMEEDEESQLRYFLISYRTNNGFTNATFKETNIPSFKRMREVVGCDFTLINLMELSKDDFESLTENKI